MTQWQDHVSKSLESPRLLERIRRRAQRQAEDPDRYSLTVFGPADTRGLDVAISALGNGADEFSDVRGESPIDGPVRRAVTLLGQFTKDRSVAESVTGQLLIEVADRVRRLEDRVEEQSLIRVNTAQMTLFMQEVNDRLRRHEEARDHNGGLENRLVCRQPPDWDELLARLGRAFRGDRATTTGKLAGYLEDLDAAGIGHDALPVLDIGSGHGEWLDLLESNGIPVQGLEPNPVLVARSRQRGHDVMLGHAPDRLLGLDDASFSAVTAFHVAEHLPFRQLVGLLREARRLVANGGLFILETPNPANVAVTSLTFHLDPTHLRPLPVDLVVFLARDAGFVDVDTRPLNLMREDSSAPPLGFAVPDDRFRLAQDYAVVCRV